MNVPVLLLVLMFFASGEKDRQPTAEGPTGVIMLDSISLHYGPVSFDHGLHMRMSDFEKGCASCHHDISPEGRVLSCRVCHSPTVAHEDGPLLGLRGAYHRQCLGCHRDWSHENACGFCHMPAMGIHSPAATKVRKQAPLQHTPAKDTYVYETRFEPLPVATFHHADHATKFGLSCVDCHHGASCSDCHGGGSVSYAMDHRMGTCFRCHDWKKCVACHDREPKQRFDHAATSGWPLGPAHRQIGCTSCHDPDHRFDAPTANRCRACHRVGRGGEFDHTALGVTLYGNHASFDCVQCHRGRLHIGKTADCAACHVDRTFPEDLPGLSRSAPPPEPEPQPQPEASTPTPP